MSTALRPVKSNAEIETFIQRWAASEASEARNSHSFLNELMDLLGLPTPPPASRSEESTDYRWEKNNSDGTSNTKRADLYKSGCFVIECKQGSHPGKPARGHGERGKPKWSGAMYDAHHQAQAYANNVEHKPVFVVICDIGYCFDIYSNFDGSMVWTPFASTGVRRILFADLLQHVELFRAIWTSPASLDPALHQAKVTTAVAATLAKLSKQLETEVSSKEAVSQFLMRCIFAMFAEDVELLPRGMFSKLLADWSKEPKHFEPGLNLLFKLMNEGGTWPPGIEILRFNGGLYKGAVAPKLSDTMRALCINLLREAASVDWTHVDPSIFGTLLERALEKSERHKLGAHFTPRAYVERLVGPTLSEPLREDWSAVRTLVNVALNEAAKAKSVRAQQSHRAKAVELVRTFHSMLCSLRVLDPACGTGNFLYVALEVIKQLEADVLHYLTDILGEGQASLALAGLRVRPGQFLGIDINPRAKPIAELVLWLGYLKWQFHERKMWSGMEVPILSHSENIKCCDALITWDGDPVARVDASGNPVTRWDGKTTKTHPVTGKQVPDDKARIPIWDYTNARPTVWPKADFIVGNPPFLGNLKQREELGNEYTEALRRVYPAMRDGSDLVMYWVQIASINVSLQKCRRAGFITTNSISQSQNRKVLEPFLTTVYLAFAVPDHPWVEDVNGAGIRIAMVVVAGGQGHGVLCSTVAEQADGDGAVAVQMRSLVGVISSDLSVGVNSTVAVPLVGNTHASFMGIKPYNSGFVLSEGGAQERIEPGAVRAYLNGRDLMQGSRSATIIDLYGLTEDQTRERFPNAYEHLLNTVKPERDTDRDAARRRNWWLHERSRPEMRAALLGRERYLATPGTSKHRVFVFVPIDVLPDQQIRVIVTDDSLYLAILSSALHRTWCSRVASTLVDSERWNTLECFEPFPFPDPPEALKQRIRKLGEDLDAHRKERQSMHPALTITGMYNVLEAIRAGRALTDKERAINEQGSVSTLKHLHDQIDAAVFEAYGWPQSLSDEEILQRLVDLNHERAEEEKRGQIRWLRPEYQRPLWEARQAKLASKKKVGAKRAETEVLADGDAVGRSFASLRMTEGGEASAGPSMVSESGPAKRCRKPRADHSGASLESVTPPDTTATVAKRVWPKGLERVVALREVMDDGVARTAKQVAALYTGVSVDEMASFLAARAQAGELLEGSIGGNTIWQKPMRPSLRPSGPPVSGVEG